MTHEQIIAELVRIWHSPHLDLSLKAGLAEAIDALKGADGDLISRQDAITIPVMPKEHRQYQTMNIDDAYERGWYDLQDCIESLPSAEAVKGEWIDIDNYYRMATCSHCLKVTMFEKWGEYTRPYNFCPNCGAYMKGGAE